MTARPYRRVPNRAATPWQGQLALLVFLAGYAVLFYRVALPINDGAALNRFDLLLECAVVPDPLIAGWFGDPPTFALLDRVPVFGAALAILATAGMAGWWLLELVRADRGLTRPESVVFACGVGTNALSLYTLVVGLAGALHERWLFVAPAIVVWLATGVRVVRHLLPRDAMHDAGRRDTARRSHDRVAPESSSEATAIGVGWLWLASPFVLAIALGSALPPIDFDVREYHLQAPKEFYLQGRVDFLPHNVYGNMPLGSEMLALLGMVVVGDWWYGALVGKVLMGAAAPLTALALLAAGERFFSRSVGVVAALVYISIPWIVQVSTTGLVEGVLSMYLLMAVYAARLWDGAAPEERLPRAALAGFLAAAAVSTKYPAAVFVFLPVFGWVIVRSWRDRAGASHAWRSVAVFVLAATIGCGAWFAKNWALTGNPVYPLLYGWFDGATRTVEKHAQWVRAHRPPGFGVEELADSLAEIGWRSDWLSPLVMPLAVLALFDRKRRRLCILLAAYFLYVVAAWWLFTHRIDRFWIPALSVASLLAGVGAMQVARWLGKPAMLAVLAIGLAVNLPSVLVAYRPYFVPLVQLRVDPNRVDRWHLYLNENTPPGKGVLCVADAEVFDLEPPAIYSTVFDDDRFDALMKGRPAAERLAALRELGVAYVFVHWGEVARYRSPGNYGYSSFATPELFDELVRQGVLAPPLPNLEGHAGQVYPVR